MWCDIDTMYRFSEQIRISFVKKSDGKPFYSYIIGLEQFLLIQKKQYGHLFLVPLKYEKSTKVLIYYYLCSIFVPQLESQIYKNTKLQNLQNIVDWPDTPVTMSTFRRFSILNSTSSKPVTALNGPYLFIG